MRSPWTPSVSVALALMGSLGCTDALSVPNPQNCVSSALSCPDGTTCSRLTQQCEPIALLQASTPSCTADPALCSSQQVCDDESGRCLPRRFVIGQPDDRTNLNVAYGMITPKAVRLIREKSTGKTKLVVADYGNDRTLIWNEVPTENRPADVVLGQQDLMTTSVSRSEEAGTLGAFFTPWSVASDGTGLFVAEELWHRISIWSAIPVKTPNARILTPSGSWGQRNSYLDPKVNAGQAAVNALGLNSPAIFAEESPGRGFYIADSVNRRVLVFDRVPTDPMTPPSWVIGQPDFTSSGVRSPRTGLGRPRGLFSDGTQLFVADQAWNRVLAFNLPITQNDPTPDAVFGQADLTSVAANQGGAPTASTLNTPTDVAVTNVGGERLLWVSDYGNNRVLRYRLPSTQADRVLGPSDFGTTLANDVDRDGKRGLLSPVSIATDGVRLVLAEPLNNRVHVWSSLPSQSGQPSDFILGQASDFSRVDNMPPAVHGLQLSAPTSVTSDGKRLFVADSGNNRVLIWNRIPKDGTTPPDVVLGQRDFTGYRQSPDGTNASGLYCPSDARSDGTRLAVADTCNNRVLIWNQIPQKDYAPADAVLGQTAMNTRAAGTSARRLSGPRAVLFVEGSLLVADTANHRVLRFDGELVTNAAATRVIGQPDMTSSAVNAGEGRTPRGLCQPAFMASDSGRLLIADPKNWRVLLWNQMPAADFQPADSVIGQQSLYANAPSADPLQQLNQAHGVLIDSGKLYVSSSFGNRVLVWDTVPTVSAARASTILGQDAPSSVLPNDLMLLPVDRLSSPMGMAAVNGRLFIADQYNNRVVSRELVP